MFLSSFYLKICPDQKWWKVTDCSQYTLWFHRDPVSQEPGKQYSTSGGNASFFKGKKMKKKKFPNQNVLWGGALIPEHIKFCKGEK